MIPGLVATATTPSPKLNSTFSDYFQKELFWYATIDLLLVTVVVTAK